MSKHCRFKVEKLLRDNIPNRLDSFQVKLTKHVMGDDEYLQSLKTKLFEEAQEVLDANGPSQLHRAAGQGDENGVQLLLNSGADKDARDEYDFTPLHFAAHGGHEKVIKVLLKAGAHVEGVVENKVTPLHSAAGYGHTGAVELLLKAKAQVDALDSRARTPLYKALMFALAKLGRDNSGKTAYILLLKGNASLQSIEKFPLAERTLVKKWGFDQSTLEKKRELLQNHRRALTNVLLERCSLPPVIAQLLFEYHNCFAIQKFLFERARLQVKK